MIIIKIILLPNIFFKKGFLLVFTPPLPFNFYYLLYNNKIFLNNDCGCFGKCKSCIFNLIEGYDNLNIFKGFNLSCQIFKLYKNIIINFFV